MEGFARKELIKELKNTLLELQGFKPTDVTTDQLEFGLTAMASAFPFGTLPTGSIHEFISPTAACATATNGFVAGLLSTLMMNDKSCLWVSTKRSLFPLGLAYFGIAPHRIIFVDVQRDKDALWVMEQALKCSVLGAVVAELNEISFAQSQRLQLAVEESRVTGFLHRKKLRSTNTLACVSRWSIRPVASQVVDGLPGVGFPAWEVTLEKIRNGKAGSWTFGWRDGQFVSMQPQAQGWNAPLPKIQHYA